MNNENSFSSNTSLSKQRNLKVQDYPQTYEALKAYIIAGFPMTAWNA